MSRARIIAELKALEPQLRAEGVQSLGLFGSQARGDAGPSSDVDLLIEFGPGVSYFDLIRLEREIGERLEREVQIATAPLTKPRFKRNVEKDLVSVF